MCGTSCPRTWTSTTRVGCRTFPIAVDTGRGWLVHGGDAYFHRCVTERGDASGVPWALRAVERFIAFDYGAGRDNHSMLAELAKRDDVTVFSAQDPVEYMRLRATSDARD